MLRHWVPREFGLGVKLLASAAVESRKLRGSPFGSTAGIWKEHRPLIGQGTITGKVVTGELFAPCVPTFTRVSMR